MIGSNELKVAIEAKFGGVATLVETRPHIYRPGAGLLQFRYLIHVFDLADNPKARRAFAWSNYDEAKMEWFLYLCLDAYPDSASPFLRAISSARPEAEPAAKSAPPSILKVRPTRAAKLIRAGSAELKATVEARHGGIATLVETVDLLYDGIESDEQLLVHVFDLDYSEAPRVYAWRTCFGNEKEYRLVSFLHDAKVNSPAAAVNMSFLGFVDINDEDNRNCRPN